MGEVQVPYVDIYMELHDPWKGNHSYLWVDTELFRLRPPMHLDATLVEERGAQLKLREALMPMSLPLLHTLYSCSYYHLSQSSSRPPIIPTRCINRRNGGGCHIKYTLLNIAAYLSKAAVAYLRHSNAEPADSGISTCQTH